MNTHAFYFSLKQKYIIESIEPEKDTIAALFYGHICVYKGQEYTEMIPLSSNRGSNFDDAILLGYGTMGDVKLVNTKIQKIREEKIDFILKK